MKLQLLLLGMLATWGSSTLQAQEKNLINAAGLMSGAYMKKTPPAYTPTNLMGGDIQNYSPEALFDQSAKLWCSKQYSKFPFTFVNELTELFVLEKLFFNNYTERNYKGISAKEVMIEVSTTSPESDYYLVGKYTLGENQIHEFKIPPTEARWIKITILSNYGNTEYTELAEFEAYGTPIYPSIKPVNLNGKWETNWGWVDFEQSGSSVSGNYEYNKGIITYGGLSRNKLTYKWIEKSANQEGWTLLFMNQEGTRLTGVWCHNNNWSKYGFWIMERKQGTAFEPIAEDAVMEVQAEVPVKKEVVAELKKSLEKEGMLILYGINFQTNSATITTDSYNVLNQVVEVLSQNPSFNILIEGHTDNVGTDAFNLKLSLDRANAVKAYFMTKGIGETRLTTNGKGENKPIADNSTEVGKGANRRVEIHLKK